MAVAVQGLYSTGNLEVILEQKLLCENTVFARSDATAAIYFIAQFCVASIREQCLLNSVLGVVAMHAITQGTVKISYTH